MSLGQSILDLFDDPTAVWKRIFESLETNAQRTFLTLASLPEPVDLAELESLVKAQAGVPALESLDSAFKALEDTFITIAPFHGMSRTSLRWGPTRWMHWAKSDRAVSFRNPGLLDFAQAIIEESPSRLAALEPLARFEQVQEIVDMGMSRLGAMPVFPRTMAYVLGHGEHYVAQATQLFVDAPPCELGGLRDAARLFALLRIMQQLHEVAGGASIAASDVVRAAWDLLLEEEPTLEVAELLRVAGIAKTLREALGRSGVADYADAVVEQPVTFDSIEMLDALRRTEPLQVNEARITQQFEEFIRASLDVLDDRYDHDDIRAEFRQLEELDGWVSEHLWAEAMGAYEDRAAATSEPPSDAYREQSKSRPPESTSEQDSDAYLAALFGSLLRER